MWFSSWGMQYAMLWSWCTNASKVSQKRLVEVVKDNNDYWFCRFSFCVLPCLFQEITSNPAFVSDNFDIVQGRFGEYCLLYNNLQSYDSKEFISVTMLSKYLYKRDFCFTILCHALCVFGIAHNRPCEKHLDFLLDLPCFFHGRIPIPSFWHDVCSKWPVGMEVSE